MKKQKIRHQYLTLTLISIFTLCLSSRFVFAALTEGHWVYEESTTSVLIDGGTAADPNDYVDVTSATILWGDGDEKSRTVVMIPAEIGGLDVSTFGNGAQNVTTNNKVSENFVLFPEGIETISARAIYDYNDTLGWSFPSSISSIDSNAFLSTNGGTYYGESGSAIESYCEDTSKTFKTYDEDGSTTFTITAGDNGYVLPNGTYHLPSALLEKGYSTAIDIVADIGYKIESITINGENYAIGTDTLNETQIEYSFSEDSSSIEVTFAEDPDDERTEEDNSYSYDCPDIVDGAVTEGAVLPDDVCDYVGISTGSVEKYINTMGISTGIYYAADGGFYEMTWKSQNQTTPEYYSKAEVINALYEDEGMVFGKDYDLVRLYNYFENVSSGPSTGEVILYTAYVYKTVTDDEVNFDDFGEVNVGDYESNDGYINTAVLFVQEGGDVSIRNLVAKDYTNATGPSEAGNFFGMGSAIHSDGGDNTTAATNILNEDTSFMQLINPQVLGPVNSVYATASGVIDILGGNIFSCSSGGHGPYVSTGGQILINVDNTNLIDADGTINIDPSTLRATKRPEAGIASMSRLEDTGEMMGEFEDHADNSTAIVTGDEAGTALATDTGGGVIVANQVSTKSYGLRSAGVYSIGYDESWVYCFNSTLRSGLDAGLCSASGGYLYAYNCDIEGVMGIKTRSGGSTSAEWTGVEVVNSSVAAYYDTDEMESVYDVATPEEALLYNEDSSQYPSDVLNLFIDKANSPSFYEDSLEWWFVDKSKTPGYSGGNMFAVIYVENSSAPITITRSKMVNQNYVEYGEVDSDDETPADNLLISVESAGTGNVTFIDDNSHVRWDLTGVSTDTTELDGDFYVGEYSEAGDDPNLGTGANTLNVEFINTEWEGAILRGDDTGVVNLVFDATSQWTVTETSTLASLTLANPKTIKAPAGYDVIMTVDDVETTILPGEYTGEIELSLVEKKPLKPREKKHFDPHKGKYNNDRAHRTTFLRRR